ncbi:hypothetical protein QF000_005497 [Paraburkholderia atlantica]|uniref:transcriptional coactivator p15/PC4 family protein n=1 Tax=Paraburkholderia atlantica TaxID=2654982 RepID=UPI003D1EEE01
MRGQKNSAPQGADKKNLTSAHVSTDHLMRFLDAVKNANERLRVDVKEYRGNTYIDIRVWYVTDDGDYRPSNKGVMFKPTLAAELLRGINLAVRSFDPKGAN